MPPPPAPYSPMQKPNAGIFSRVRIPRFIRDTFPISLFFNPPDPYFTGIIVVVSSFLFFFWLFAFLVARFFFPESTLNPMSWHSGPGNSLPASCPRFGRRYGVMFDAGSTGSRVHVYDFTFELDGSVKLHNELFEQVKPGLSSYKGKPEEAAKSIDVLLEKSIAAVPEHARPCTPVELKATAGLRLLGESASNELLKAVDSLFREHTTFFVPKDAAIVMDGADEGPLAWITVNFLLGTLFNDANKKDKNAPPAKIGGITPPSHPVAVFDMGGASTQIVFLPTTEQAAKKLPSKNQYKVSLFGKEHSVYQHSHLGYGLKEAGKSIAALASDPEGFECFPQGYTGFKAQKGKIISNSKSALQSHTICSQYVRKFINKQAPCKASSCSFNGIFQPKLGTDFENGEFYIFSYFYDRMEHFLPESGVMTVGDYKRIGKKICESASLKEGGSAEDEMAKKVNLGTECMDFIYLYELMSTGYDLSDSQTVNIKKKINGVETAWTLGAMILAMQ